MFRPKWGKGVEKTEHLQGMDPDQRRMFRPYELICRKRTEQPGGLTLNVPSQRWSINEKDGTHTLIASKVSYAGIYMFLQNRQHLFRIKSLPGIIKSEEKGLVRDPV